MLYTRRTPGNNGSWGEYCNHPYPDMPECGTEKEFLIERYIPNI
jgi:hypothetical protein